VLNKLRMGIRRGWMFKHLSSKGLDEEQGAKMLPVD